MTTLYIRHPAKASVDSAPLCQFALAGDGGNVLQQGTSALSGMGEMIAAARRVVLLVAAADVTLLRLKMPPLSAARLKAALPNLVEEHILGDPADCVLSASVSSADGMRTVAVVQRAWLDALVKALLALGARSVAAFPAQLCLHLPAGGVAAALQAGDGVLELSLRLAPHEGMGLSLPVQDPQAVLGMLRAFAVEAPVTLYLSSALQPFYQEAAAAATGISIEPDQWAHWISASKTAGIDMVPALGAAGTQARNWQRWRWPLRLALLAVIVNIVGVNLEWMRLKREAGVQRAAVLQSFKSVYPNETPLYPAEQMRRNIARAKLASGQLAADEFLGLTAALGEAMGPLAGSGAIAKLEYREHGLIVKLKPDTVNASAAAQVKAALAARKLELSEPTPGTWQIHTASGVKS